MTFTGEDRLVLSLTELSRVFISGLELNDFCTCVLRPVWRRRDVGQIWMIALVRIPKDGG